MKMKSIAFFGLGPLGLHEGVLLDVLIDADEVEEGALEGAIEVGVVRPQVPDCRHALEPLELPHDQALEQVVGDAAKAEISLVEQVRDTQRHQQAEVGKHVLDPKGRDRRENDLEPLCHAEQVQGETGAPEAQVCGRRHLERFLARREGEVGASEAGRGGLDDVVDLLGEHEGHDDGIGTGYLGHRVQLLGHVARVVVVGVARVAPTGLLLNRLGVRIAFIRFRHKITEIVLRTCNSSQNHGTNGKLRNHLLSYLFLFKKTINLFYI